MKHQEHFPLNDKEKALLHMEEEKLGQPLKELTGGPAYSMCFACGSDNPIGLHLHFFSIPKGCLPTPAKWNPASAPPYSSGRR